ncbi:hypothetical protein [Streptomyces formicae]
MGIESDQLVFDYLSRVGDLAQQRQLPSGTRMRLVSRLRNEIDRSRAKAVADNPAAIRRILARLGTPEEVVESAGDTSGDPSGERSGDIPTARSEPRAAVPTQRGARPRRTRTERAEPAADGASETLPKALRRMVPRPRRTPAPAPEPEAPAPEPWDERPAPPHLAGTDELGPSGSEPDWWRVDSSPFGFSDSVPGFVGGVEIPEILKPPPSPDDAREKNEGDEEYEEEEAEGVEEAEGAVGGKRAGRRRRWRVRRARPGGGTGEGPTLSNPLLLLAAALLTVGAVLGNLIALGVGWLIAYASRRLSRTEAKMAALGLPALSVAAGLTWLWGRSDGRWGDPIEDGHMSGAIADTWPWVVRGAAVASALFLLWRSQRQRP